MKKAIITFEDWGQDFLTWTVSENGKLLHSDAQFSFWKQWEITNWDELAVGGPVLLKKGTTRLRVRYMIENLQIVDQ